MFMSIDSRIAQAVGQLVATDTNLRVTDIQSTVGNLAFSVSRTPEGRCDGDVRLPLLVIDLLTRRSILPSFIYLQGRILSSSKHIRSVSYALPMVIRSLCIHMMQSFFRTDEKSS